MSGLKYRRPVILDEISLDRHAAIEAGAGTGKTFTLENLVVEILVKGLATIDKVLVVTFTERAAGELRLRMRNSIRAAVSGASVKDAPPEEIVPLNDEARERLDAALAGFDRAAIYTIHGFCRRTLAEFALAAGMRFSVEPVDGESAFREAFRAELRDNLSRSANLKVLLEEWLTTRSVASLEDLLVRANQVRVRTREKPVSLESRLVGAFLPPILSRMKSMKIERGVLDYDDMLEWLAGALEGQHGAAIAAELRERYRFALVDEFQDTDETQWNILKRTFLDGATASRLYVIGDPRQSIYAFRRADVYAYLSACAALYERGATRVPLIRNFRSTASLIDAINTILDQKVSAPFFPRDSRLRYDNPVICGRMNFRAFDHRKQQVFPVRLMRIPAGAKLSADKAREAVGRCIAATIRTIVGREQDGIYLTGKNGALERVGARDIFVLTRTNPESLKVGEYLRDAGVPFAFYKREGLFQTREAEDIAEALKAVLDPEDRSGRMTAWLTPFFAQPLSELPRLRDLPSSHPLLVRLREWKSLGDAERFAELFDAMVNRSGLAARELLLSGSERALTNYLHIFEILQEQACARSLPLAELIELLDDFIAGRALPPGEDSNVQRLESERAAVQVMTMHKAKGLEAGVVFIFGGTHGGGSRDTVAVYHDRESGLRKFAIGAEEREAASARIKDEAAEEDRRLMYVSITRPRAKLFLPYFPKGALTRELNGPYRYLNDRLRTIAPEIESGKSPQSLIEIEDILPTAPILSETADNFRVRLRTWDPPEVLFADSVPLSRNFDLVRRRHAPLTIQSYTSIAAEQGELEMEDFKIDREESASTDLTGGREVGIFLHEAIEKLDMETIRDASDRDRWMARDEVHSLVAGLMLRHGIRDDRWLNRGCELIWNALVSPIALGGLVVCEGLRSCRSVREMEFTFPIPERNHWLFGRSDGGWRAERGYLRGVVDFVFEHQGLIYFADWKSDFLPSYEPEALASHVARHYPIQEKIYTVGVSRLLAIRSERDYREKFGGVAYIFLRGIAPSVEGRRGVHFIRPSWSEVTSYESSLMDPVDAGGLLKS